MAAVLLTLTGGLREMEHLTPKIIYSNLCSLHEVFIKTVRSEIILQNHSGSEMAEEATEVILVFENLCPEILTT